jgi:hypothetical protein
MVQIFPKWSNFIPKIIVFVLFFGLCLVIFIFSYWFSPWNLEVGYKPKQPIPYSHELHVGKLGIDCRYCHFGVEKSICAGVPPTQICMNCHTTILRDSNKIIPIIKNFKNNKPIEWIRVHKLPDYVYFSHSSHVNVGIGCVSCHGRVDKMERVKQVKPLSMAWCLECHRNPETYLIPMDKITSMNFVPSDEWKTVARKKAVNLNPPVIGCSGCHR